MYKIAADDAPKLEDRDDFYGIVHGYNGQLSMPLPQMYNMPRFAIGEGYSRGQYVAVNEPYEFKFDEDVQKVVDFWHRDRMCRVFIGRGDGYLLHAPTASGEMCAVAGMEEEWHAQWPSSGLHADRMEIPPEWLRPIAECLLKMADHLEGASSDAPETDA